MKRRDFLNLSLNASLSYALGASFLSLSACTRKNSKNSVLNGKLQIPQQFKVQFFSKENEIMNDGLPVPNRHDGMACFPGHKTGVEYVLVRNHECHYMPEKFKSPNPEMAYDKNASGGTTTIELDKNLNVVNHYLSLTGTVRNCSGGKMPWNTWISCEEVYTNSQHRVIDLPKSPQPTMLPHGYAFEVDPYAGKIQKPKVLKYLGRFQREAVAWHAPTQSLYQTEDETQSCLYRYISLDKNKLKSGGKLQALKIDTPQISNTNLKSQQKYSCSWVDVPNPEATQKTCVQQATEKGAAIFSRGEGIVATQTDVFFTATDGGKQKAGQIFRYTPQGADKGELSLLLECNPHKGLKFPDQLTYNQWGDLIICEDNDMSLTSYLYGIRPDGKSYEIAKSTRGEFSGPCFSPDGKILFVNVQKMGISMALNGNWSKLRQQV